MECARNDSPAPTRPRSAIPPSIACCAPPTTPSSAAARGQQAEIGRLTEESGLYHAAIEALPQGVCVFDGQARLAVCNRRYAELYRLDRSA